MPQCVRWWCTWALLLGLATALEAPGQEVKPAEQLQKAVKLFDQHEYQAAQDALRDIDRAKLSKDEQAEFDYLKKALPEALTESQKAKQKLASAEEAFDSGQWDQADALYQAVLDSKFAKPAWKATASQQRERVAEKKKLAQAAEPSGVVAQPAPLVEAPPAEAPPPAPAAGPAPTQRLSPVAEQRQRDELLWQRAVAQSQELAARAREAMGQNNYNEARQLADLSLEKVEAARNYAEPPAKYLAARDAAQRLRDEVAAGNQKYQADEAFKRQQEIKARVAERNRLMEQQRRDKVEQLFLSAAQLRKQQRFAEAAEVLRQVLYIDPANAKAQAQLEIAEDYDSLTRQGAWQHDVDTQQRASLVKAEEALVPWDYEVLYPRNWLELTARRAAGGVGAGGSEDDELNRKMKEIVPEFRFEEVDFESVVDNLREIEKINIAVDWDNLEAQGIERRKPVTMQLRGLPFESVLKLTLDQVGGDTKLGFSVSEGLLRIATREKLDREKFVRVYDIRDLLVGIPRFTNAARMDPSQAINQQGQLGGGGGSSAQLFQYSQQQQGPGGEWRDVAGVRNEMVPKVLEIIRQTAQPDSWQESGGEASIRELNGQLIIYNTSDAHTQISSLLDQLRATRALQIAMEARFLNVTSNFLEEFGVDLDFVFNSGNAGFDRTFAANGAPAIDPFTGANILLPRPYSRIGATPTPPAFGTPIAQGTITQPYAQAGLVPAQGGGMNFNEMTPITAQQGSMALADVSSRGTGVPGTFAGQAAQSPALNIAGSFLDGLQVDFLIRATQANARSSIVQAPRLVMFNGQRANISVGRSRQYVSSVTPTVAENAVAVQPVIAQAPSGTVLDVEGTITADRKYVTLTVITTQTDEPTFERFEVQRASGSSPGIFILLPNQSFVTINTTVSIPDGGTVLLGGLKQAGEVEVEAGVPILSKVPVLKRAFSNKSLVKDTRTLLILMKAKIIIQKEAEEEAFPTMTAVTGGMP